MHEHDGRVLSVPRQVIGHVDESRDGPLAVFARVVHQEGLDHVLGAHAGNQRVRDLVRLSGCHRVHPQIVRRGWAIVVVKQSRSVFGEAGRPSCEIVHAFRHGQRRRRSGDQIVDIDVRIPVYIRSPGDAFAVRRESAALDLPLVLGQPRDLLAGDIDPSHVLVAVVGIGGDQHFLAVRRNIICGVEMFTVMRCQHRALAGGCFRDQDIRIRSLGLRLRIDDPLAVFRPDRPAIPLVLRSVAGDVLHLAHHHVVHVNLHRRRSLRLHRVREVAAVGRPRRSHFRDLACVGQVHDLPGLR